MAPGVDVVFLWHMHQPDYRADGSGEFMLPWVYLHAIKDYSDMAYHLEQHPQIHAVVNFVPVLLEQLEDYAQQIASGQLRDPLLRLLAREDLGSLTTTESDLILDSCFRSDHEKMVAPYPSYKRLSDLYRMLSSGNATVLSYLSGQYMADLLTWYHLVWCGESLRREHQLVIGLMSKAENFTYAERKALFDLIGQEVSRVIPRYRALAERGQIEISSTPYNHPLAPLLLDFHSARESIHDSSLPHSPAYPGGRHRVEAQLAAAISSHERRFGHVPQGIWPAEGAVSTALLGVLADQGCRWTASGQSVLANSLRQQGAEVEHRWQYLYRPYHVEGDGNAVSCFFRDDKLSDAIGFEYATWNGNDAAHHFVSQLEAVMHQVQEDRTPIVSVVLDGENAWEYYPYNGYHFLNDLYTMLEQRPYLRTTTYAAYLDRQQESAGEGMAQPATLSRLVAGSWVYGTFSTWIGSPDKNRAWDLLCMAKQNFDMVIASGRLNQTERAAVEKHLASCESSDWFWWFGDYNPAHAVASFDRLYRRNLAHLYRLLKLTPPAVLDQPISHGSGSHVEAGGTMRRGS